jgi:hypothetical protein
LKCIVASAVFAFGFNLVLVCCVGALNRTIVCAARVYAAYPRLLANQDVVYHRALTEVAAILVRFATAKATTLIVCNHILAELCCVGVPFVYVGSSLFVSNDHALVRVFLLHYTRLLCVKSFRASVLLTFRLSLVRVCCADGIV